ncbi:MAG: hypothetical protein ACI9CA_001475 [Natronomonas sp.]|jgi:uncharacterized protein (TIGR02118 family)
MLKIVALVEKREGMGWHDFIEYWDEEHVTVISDVPNLKRYTIAPAVKPEDAPYDGVAELYFESTEDIREGFTEELDRRIREDEERFLDSVDTFVAAEQTQIDET